MTKVFEIKIGRNWEKVRATSMMALNNWGKENGVKDWRMVGMMSSVEIIENQNLRVVA